MTHTQERRTDLLSEVMRKIYLLDEVDRAKVDERITYFLEADKYKRPHLTLVTRRRGGEYDK